MRTGETEQAHRSAAGEADKSRVETAKEEASQAVGQAKSKVSEVADQAQEKAQGMAQQARGQLRDQVQQRSTQAGERVSSTAQDVRSIGEQLRSQGKDSSARIADQAAGQAERLGRYLKQSDADQMLRDVEDLARRQPWAVVAGGIALGFAASRFLKASSSERYRSSSGYAAGWQRTLPATGTGVGHRAQLPSVPGGQ